MRVELLSALVEIVVYKDSFKINLNNVILREINDFNALY